MNLNKKFKTFLLLTVCFLTISILAGLISIFISYYAVSVTKYEITHQNITETTKIVMLADLHDSSFGKNNSRLVEKVKEEDPDLIFTVGDMLSYYTEDYSYLESLYSQLSDIAPTYCSLGNHEVAHEESEEIKRIINKYSDGLLEYNYVDLTIKGNDIRIGGLSLYYYNHPKYNTFVKEFSNTDRYTILLHHQPEYYLWGIEDYDIDLSLSGHTHGGQVIVPFKGGIYAPEQSWWPEYDYGLFTEENGNNIIITRGLGSSSQPAPRFNNIPEIVSITLSAEESYEQ